MGCNWDVLLRGIMIKSRLSCAAAVSAGIVFGGIGPAHGAAEISPAVGDAPPAQIALPPMHTTIAAPEPRRAEPPTRPFEVAGATEMLFDRDPAAPGDDPVELAQAGALSVNDWLMREQTNPNVRRTPAMPAPYPQVPAPTYSRASPAYHTFPAAQGHPRHAPPAPATGRNWTPPDDTPKPQDAAKYRPMADTAQKPGFSTARGWEDEKRLEQQLGTLTRFYVGGGGGLGRIDFDPSLTSEDETVSSAALKGFGGIRLNKYFAGEFQLAKIAKTEESNNSGDSRERDYYSFAFSGLVTLPLSSRFVPFAKGGGHVWWTKVSATGNLADEGSTSDFEPFFGVGLDVHISKHFSVRTEWEHYYVDDSVENGSANVYSASILLNF